MRRPVDHDVLTVRNSMSRPISAAFGKGSGRARGTLKTQTGGLENPDGRSGRAQVELAAEKCTRRRRSSHIDALLTVPITASCGRARGRAAKLLAGLAHRGARLIDDAGPTSENENAAEIGREPAARLYYALLDRRCLGLFIKSDHATASGIG